ncbi:rRNA maturation RNase YbeY [Pollutimonas subterranea]|uniref:Endoribonuclease YbeY n=1 Tax=Pollutimonas subterranea TaxID=2045210 RepID=A0A2N4U0J9_9BURK|nr:rRNA maturation RNase YbeY [Pollutimonas subterranea]PLC48548.1 rRNA maturation RNase YbeY [Pollutimonas subterranea]
MSPDPQLSLAIQYGTQAPELPRWRLRRWVRQAVNGVAHDLDDRNASRSTGGSPQSFTSSVLTLRLVDLDEGRTLNRDYRDRDYATNVLTFEYGVDPSGTASGDIVLCVPVLHREAAEQGKELLSHAAHLTVHGVLHALGYDHIVAADAEEMEALEVEILGRMGISNPYRP